jgi:hypothetical protein
VGETGRPTAPKPVTPWLRVSTKTTFDCNYRSAGGLIFVIFGILVIAVTGEYVADLI